MKKVIKPPVLSTSFSENGKRVKKRFENIFNKKRKKKGVMAFAAVLCMVLAAGALVACERQSIGIIGGSDGPTSIFISESKDKETRIEELYNSKIKYTGNNSGVSKIVGLLPFAQGVALEKIELQTDKEPYGITLNYVIDDYSKAVIDDTVQSGPFHKNAALMFCLIENADRITINIQDETKYKGAVYSYTYSRADFDVIFDKPVSEYSDDFENFKALFVTLENGTIDPGGQAAKG